MSRPVTMALCALALGSGQLAVGAQPNPSEFVGKAIGEDEVRATFDAQPLLQAFDFSFLSSDHHLQRVSVIPDPQRNKVRIRYSDKNRDDAFKWSASFVQLDDPRIVRGSISREARSKGFRVHDLPRPRGNFVFALVGFSLSYTVGDHHIDKIGIYEKAGELTVVMNDKNNDDPFYYTINYAYLPGDLVQLTDRVSGRARGQDFEETSLGIPVLSGFLFDYSSKDHQLRRMAVEPRNGSVQVAYHDKNSDDKFSWSVDVTILKDTATPTKLSTSTIAPIGPHATTIRGARRRSFTRAGN